MNVADRFPVRPAARLIAATAFVLAASLSPVGPALAADGLAPVVSTQEMLSRLNQPWVQLIDLRSAEEFDGRDIRALRGGHIPGAISVPVGAGDDAVAVGTALAAHLQRLDLRKETVVYGHDASIASQVAEQLRRQGFRQVRVYADAWQVWGNRLDLPVEGERYADVAALREQVVELQRAVDRLSGRASASR